jgi:hypothetical protein
MTNKKRIIVPGNRLVHTIQELITHKNVRRVCLIDEEKSILEIPFTLGDPGAPAAILKAPILAAIKAYGTLAGECTIEVESIED